MRLYGKYFAMHLKSLMQYKLSSFMMLIGHFLISFSVFLGIYFMYLRFTDVKGYTYQDSLICFSVVLLSFTLSEMFARGFDSFSSILGNGEFDRIMVRPRNIIGQVLGARMELVRVGKLVQALIIFAYVMITTEFEITVLKAITLLFMVIGGTALFSAMFILRAGICFFTTEGLEFMNVFTDGAREYGKYPYDIYGSKVLAICTFIVPYALFQYYPFLYISDRSDNPLYIFLPLLAALFLIPAGIVWKSGVRHYKSTGS